MSNGHLVSASTITSMMVKAVRYHMNHPAPDSVLGIETHLSDTLLQAKSCRYDFDLGLDMYLNVGRWSRLIKEYVDKNAVERFIFQAQYILQGNARKGAVTEMRFKDPIRSEKKHKWGGCLMGAVFRGERGHEPTLIFYSRTTYLGYMGQLDAAVASVLARMISPKFYKEFRFKWYIANMQFHCFKSLPYMYTRSVLDKKLIYYNDNRNEISKLPPTWRDVLKWYIRMIDHYELHGEQMVEIEKYGPYKRVKRRWLEHQGVWTDKIPPSLPISKLGFSKAVNTWEDN